MNNYRGFTLIEVLIALTILAIALTAVMFSVQVSIKSTNHIRDKLAAHWVAMNIISSIQVGVLPSPTDSFEQGDSEMLNRVFCWKVKIDQSENNYYERVTVDVRLKNASVPLEHLIGFIKI